MSDMKSTKKTVEQENVDDRFPHSEEEQDGTQEEQSEDLGAEETQQESSPEETSEPEEEKSTEEKVDELDELKKQVNELRDANESIKDGMQKRIDQLTYELKSKQEAQEKSSKEKTWDDLNVDELKQYRNYYREQGDDNMVDFVNDKIAESMVESKLNKSQKLQENSAIRVQSWQEVTNDYPELEDKDSEHYKRTIEVVKNNPELNDIEKRPKGHAIAARLVAERMLHEKMKNLEKSNKEVNQKVKEETRKNSLDSSSGKQVPPSKSAKIEKMMRNASDTKNPYGPEWKKVLREINKKAS